MWDFYGIVHSNYLFVKKLITIYLIAHKQLDGDFLYKNYGDKSASMTCWDHQ
jgi:hypothetical protein